MAEVVDVSVKEKIGVAKQSIWERKDRTHDPKFTPVRIEYQIDLRRYGIEKGIDFLMVNQGDYLTDNDVWRPKIMENTKSDPERAFLNDPEIFEMSEGSVVDKVNEWREKLGLGVNEDVELIGERKVPEVDSRYWSVLDGIAACSLYDSSGDVKRFNDGEAQMLLFSWLTFKGLDDKVSGFAYEELINRAGFLKLKVNENEEKEVEEIRSKKPSWGEIPYDKIRMVHVNNYGPAANEGRVAIAPQIDVSGYPRYTVHTFLNGMVEEHGMEILGLKNSWESHSYAMIMPFDDLIVTNGLPESTLAADTFWATRPGIGLTLPERAVLILPEGREVEKYGGLECISYNPESTTLRAAIKTYFDKEEIPFLTNITDTEGLYDPYPRFNIPVKNSVHESTESSDEEREMRWMKRVTKVGEEWSLEELRRLKAGKDDCFLTSDEAEELSVRTNHSIHFSHKAKLYSLAMANMSVWNVLAGYAKEGKSIEYWETLVKTGIL